MIKVIQKNTKQANEEREESDTKTCGMGMKGSKRGTVTQNYAPKPPPAAQ